MFQNINNSIFFFFYNLAHHSKLLDGMFIFFAETLPYIVVVLAFLFLIFHHEVFKKNPFKALVEKYREIFSIFLSVVFAWGLAYILKYLVHSQRPFSVFSEITPLISESGFAFPSGHATFFMALALAIYFHHKKAGYIFIAFALLIGISRIIVGVHFPLDILGGYVLAFAIAFFLKNV